MPIITPSGFGSTVSVRVVIPDAQIKTMDNSAPVALVPPTVVLGYVGSPPVVFVPLRALAVLDNAAGAYTNFPNPMGIALCWGADESVDVATGKWATLTDVHNAFSTQTSPNNLFDFPPTAMNISHLDSNMQDNGLYVVWTGGVGPLTGGNAANTLAVTVEYQAFTP